MPDIAFMTYIHNGEKTMQKSIESVLNQEDVELAYYLIDNASTDSTWDIMCEYAERDSRIRLIQNENSLVKLPEYIKSIKDCEYFAVLDADDCYEPVFAREAIHFAKKEDLDIVAVGICYSSSREKEYRKEDKPVILTCDEFKEHIGVFSAYFSAMWGKVYRISVVQGMNTSRFETLAAKRIFFGIDTIFSLSAVQASRKVGVLDQALLQYYEVWDSDSRRHNPNRFYAITALIEMWSGLFVDVREMRQIDFKNFAEIAMWYYKLLLDTFAILVQSDLDTETFLKESITAVTFPLTGVCMQERPELKSHIMSLMINRMQGMKDDQKTVALFYECLKAMDAVELFQEMVKK